MTEDEADKSILTLSEEIFDMKSSGGVPSTSIIRFNCCMSGKNRIFTYYDCFTDGRALTLVSRLVTITIHTIGAWK